MLCPCRENELQDKEKVCWWCFEKFRDRLKELEPSIFQLKTSEGIVPGPIFKTMPRYLIEDIDDALRCLENELWTPTLVMSARIFERELINFTVADLQKRQNASREELIKSNSLNSIGSCIDALELQNYPDSYVNELNDLKRLRNRAINSIDRFRSDHAIGTFKKVLINVCWMYNFTF